MNEKLGTFELWNNIQKYYYFYKMSKTTIKRQREILNVYCEVKKANLKKST